MDGDQDTGTENASALGNRVLGTAQNPFQLKVAPGEGLGDGNMPSLECQNYSSPALGSTPAAHEGCTQVLRASCSVPHLLAHCARATPTDARVELHAGLLQAWLALLPQGQHAVIAQPLGLLQLLLILSGAVEGILWVGTQVTQPTSPPRASCPAYGHPWSPQPNSALPTTPP